MRKTLLFLCSCFFLSAQESPSHLSFRGGVFEIVRHNKHQTEEFGVEYRPSLNWYTLRPLMGFMFTVNGSTYLYGGVAFEWLAKKRVLFAPSFALGWYRPGGGKNLHFPLEFRSGFEMAWQFRSKARIGAQFYHISNASLGKKNPGEESLVFFISVPLN